MNTEKKGRELIIILKQKGTWITCKELAKLLDIPSRSVRYIISKINASDLTIISSSKGYRLKKMETPSPEASFTSTLNPETPKTPEERRKYIFEQIVILDKIIQIDVLCNYFCISPFTFRNELLIWKKELSEYGLYLKTKNNKIYSIGSDRDKSRFTMNLIRNELKHSYFSLDSIQQLFKKVRLTDIKQIIVNILSKHQYYLDDYSLLTYVLHLAVYIEINNDFSTKAQHSNKYKIEDIGNPEITEIVTEICESLEKYYVNIHFSREDIIDASLLMITRIISQKIQSKEMTDGIECFVEPKVTALLTKIFKSVNDVYCIDLNNNKFMFRFAIHIKNLLIRAKNNISISNGQFVNIKNDYPFLYVIAVHISHIINKNMGVVLSEDEIAYIALHVGVIIQETTVQQEKLVCAVVVPDYYVIGKKICEKLSQTLGDVLFIQTLVSNYDQIKNNLGNFDLIISTYTLDAIDFPNIIVGPFLDDTNIKCLRSKIESLLQQKNKNKIIQRIEKFFREDLVYIGNDFKTSYDAIEFMCNDFLKKKLVRKSFKKEIIEHESIAASSYNKIAIAHTLSNNDIHSFIALSINPKAVQWGENKVNLIFLISLTENDRKEFKDIFNFLVKFISEPQAFSEMLKIKNYKELKEFFNFYL